MYEKWEVLERGRECPVVAEKLGIVGVLRSPGALGMLRLKVLGKTVGWAWWVV